ncbi:MAG: hypothetical protein LBF72_02785 [Holosporales bacterium]|jgi:hypothetical protein|nr:hypothetical protein [Holosporales bacterium]
MSDKKQEKSAAEPEKVVDGSASAGTTLLSYLAYFSLFCLPCLVLSALLLMVAVPRAYIFFILTAGVSELLGASVLKYTANLLAKRGPPATSKGRLFLILTIFVGNLFLSFVPGMCFLHLLTIGKIVRDLTWGIGINAFLFLGIGLLTYVRILQKSQQSQNTWLIFTNYLAFFFLIFCPMCWTGFFFLLKASDLFSFMLLPGIAVGLWLGTSLLWHVRMKESRGKA